MKLTTAEAEYLSAWAREEWEPECYQQPAHRQQLAHRVSGVYLIDLIKAWTVAEGKKDQDIVQMGTNRQPVWPWPTSEEFTARFQQTWQKRTCRPVR
jgi:hypothetical protein